MSNQTEAVDRFLEGLDHPLKEEIGAVRSVILGTDAQITEHIKGNAPSFCDHGDHRVTCKRYPDSRLRLAFRDCQVNAAGRRVE